MKIRGTCKRDGRDWMVEQVVAAGGACPWDGEPYSADYAVTLVDALRDAELAGSALQLALQKIADLAPDFTLSESSVTGPLRDQLARLERNLVRRG